MPGRGTGRRFAGSILAVFVAATMGLAGAPPAGATEDDQYTLEWGDTLSELAQRFATTVRAIMAANAIADPDRIQAGQTLEVPRGPSSTAATPPAHVVAPGESLSSIAARYGVTVADLAAANGIVDTNRVWVGSRLWIASEAPASPQPEAAATHLVEAGETLSGIAARYGVTVADLVAANGLADPNRVLAGVTLRVPGGWRCPVPAVERAVDDFGSPRSGGRFHDGIDLFAPRGSPVVAPVGGVALQERGTRAGLQVRLEGDDGMVYFHTHLDAFGASGRVEAGDTIGAIGNSGNARGTAPHLHFEMHPADGPAANPFAALTAACGFR